MTRTFVSIAAILFFFKGVAGALPVFEGGKTTWHGFDRYDFVMDDQTLAITPFTAPPGEGDGISDPPQGTHRCVVVVPKEFAPGNPWSWRGCYWNHMPQAEIALLHQGFCIAYISAGANLRPGRQWDAWYGFLTEHGLSPKPVFIGMSRGGEFSYMWATLHPDKVSGIYVDNPGANWGVMTGIAALATNDVPLLHVCGSLDPLLGRVTLPIESMYQQFGGRISVMIKEGDAHHPHSLPDPKPIVDFIMQSVYETNSPPPDFAGKRFTRTSFYSNEEFYRYFPSEGKYITCRGPMFTPCYDRYQFGISNFSGGGLTIIAPRTPAPGNPWVFRSDLVDQNQAVDLALLAKGYYIVTGPVPYDVGPVPAQWDAAYNYLITYGFSKKPVMEGNGAAAGEAFAWAMANPNKVSCIYSENPIMHSNLSKIPLLDSLGILAKAGIPIIDVSGDLDPNFEDNTLIMEKRYQKLGGSIKVIVESGRGHYPLSPEDPKPVVDFITRANGDGY
ncbi:MAG TPA: alpha/beta hydrolase [Candidatus Acidoferrales bacterium]|jgi:hypothetical protein|nr:alpha/beta hydrolase [Candidatus Acidoferrales bacterium]